VSVLIWLVPVVLVAVAAAGWTAWMARPRPPADLFDSVDAHRRFVAALERARPVATAPPAARPSDQPSERASGTDRSSGGGPAA